MRSGSLRNADTTTTDNKKGGSGADLSSSILLDRSDNQIQLQARRHQGWLAIARLDVVHTKHAARQIHDVESSDLSVASGGR